jgi:hypothetical protein
MAPIKHIIKSVAKRASMSLSSFLSNVLLLEGTFIEFIITCNVIQNVSNTVEQLQKESVLQQQWNITKIY